MEYAKNTSYIKKIFQEASGNQKKQKEIKKIDLKRMTVGLIGAIKRQSFPGWGRLQEPHAQVKTLRLHVAAEYKP